MSMTILGLNLSLASWICPITGFIHQLTVDQTAVNLLAVNMTTVYQAAVRLNFSITDLVTAEFTYLF